MTARFSHRLRGVVESNGLPRAHMLSKFNLGAMRNATYLQRAAQLVRIRPREC